jgi:putative hemolysin
MEKRREIVVLGILILVIMILVAIVLIFTGNQPVPSNQISSTEPNPAAIYCRNLNYTYEIRTNPDGSQYGVCILPDGTVCDEWEFYRGACPANAAPTTVTTTSPPAPNPSEVYCASRNYTYKTTVDQNGTVYGFCVFPNGAECGAWDFYLGACNETTAQIP